MTQPVRMTVFLAGKRYSITESKLLAYGEQPGGPGREAPQRAVFLFRANDGVYFAQYRTSGGSDPHDERIWMEAVAPMDAAPLFAELEHKQVSFDEAFSGD